MPNLFNKELNKRGWDAHKSSFRQLRDERHTVAHQTTVVTFNHLKFVFPQYLKQAQMESNKLKDEFKRFPIPESFK